jgi:hypothetical protein
MFKTFVSLLPGHVSYCCSDTLASCRPVDIEFAAFTFRSLRNFNRTPLKLTTFMVYKILGQ